MAFHCPYSIIDKFLVIIVVNINPVNKLSNCAKNPIIPAKRNLISLICSSDYLMLLRCLLPLLKYVILIYDYLCGV